MKGGEGDVVYLVIEGVFKKKGEIREGRVDG